MFQNINYLSKLLKKFIVKMVSDDENQYFVIKIMKNSVEWVEVMANVSISNIDTIKNSILNYTNSTEIINFIFIQTY